MFRVIIAVFILNSVYFSQQIVDSKNEGLSNGEAVMHKAKDAVGLSSSMTSFLIKLHRVSKFEFQGKDFSDDSQVEIAILLPTKIRILYVAKAGTSSTGIWNERKFRQTLEFEINGQRQVVDTTNGTPLSSAALDAVKSKKTDIKSLGSRADEFSDSLWGSVFPLILMHPIESSAKFEYLGRAQAGERIARAVQTKSATGNMIQLFFDEKTNYLLLMIEKFKRLDREYENKYYYSNHEERNGISVPTKVKVEHKITFTGQAPVIYYEYIDLLDFEANPAIKPEVFKIK